MRKKISLILVIGVILVALIIFNKQITNNINAEVTSYPISSAISYPELSVRPKKWKIVTDVKQGITLKYLEGLDYYKQNEYFGRKLEKNVINIVDSQNPNDTRFNIKIIPIKTTTASTALKTLESYIVNYVGIVPKNNQRNYKMNGFDIAQIGYKPDFGDDGNYFRIYTLMQKGSNAWIITTGYITDFPKSDSLNMNNSEESNLYNEFIISFQSNLSEIKEEVNQIDDVNRLDKKVIEQYHNFNSKFQSEL